MTWARSTNQVSYPSNPNQTLFSCRLIRVIAAVYEFHPKIGSASDRSRPREAASTKGDRFSIKKAAPYRAISLIFVSPRTARGARNKSSKITSLSETFRSCLQSSIESCRCSSASDHRRDSLLNLCASPCVCFGKNLNSLICLLILGHWCAFVASDSSVVLVFQSIELFLVLICKSSCDSP